MQKTDSLKDPDAGKDWRQEEKGTTEDEMAGWHHWLFGCESEWTPGVGDGQGGMLQFMGSQRVGHNWATELNWTLKTTMSAASTGQQKGPNSSLQQHPTMFQELNELGYKVLPHLSNSLDLLPTNYHFCKHTDNFMPGKSFHTSRRQKTLSTSSSNLKSWICMLQD